ncbi:hypothetical protein PENANT_c005G00011 [Penicillium antarcticum]|uniref:Copper homeostasis protein cutC homolog n=1 Tax=Penicillium antarcticum TaxID=416450 RepID=A0A1V6QE96_9EURO|nr:uncharacterized protein N7508_007558 [Penicillium antarcticum]KAJ5297309.1 hypothetical protein N7508_007558 [Penicillium antarcticum]OQD87543.1 hypothetical protein PENANT_c005G00011 [Penicillium antarcticum]
MSPRISDSLLEIACFNYESALAAAEGGADRIELCKDYTSGGLSPDTKTLEQIKSQITIPIYAMIRPRAENFFYDEAEFESMKITLNSLKTSGADGFVFGILNQFPHKACNGTEHWIDVSRNKALVQLAEGHPCTFHRAFDVIPEAHWATALADIKDCGFASLLTNGGPSGIKAAECTDQLAKLVAWKQTSDHQAICPVKIIVGGGVRSSNIGMLLEATGASAFHSAALLDSNGLASKDEVRKMKAMTTTVGGLLNE